MKRFFVFFLTLFIVFNWIHAKNEAHGQDTFTVELEEQGSGPYNGAFKIDIEFGTLVIGSDFVPADFTFGGSAAQGTTVTLVAEGSASKGTRQYTGTITPGRSGTLTIDIEADAITAKDGKKNADADTLTVTIDMDKPTVGLSGMPTTPQNGAFTITVTFNENVTDFDDDDDITLSDDDATVSISRTNLKVYTATITPSEEGELTIQVPANAAIDGANNGNTASTESTVTIDKTAPTVTITGLPSGTQTDAFEVTVEFNKDVTDFDDTADVTLGGTATATASITRDAADEYTVTITPTTEGTVTITVPADAAVDAATNGNTASAESDEINVDPVHPTATLSTTVTGKQNDDFDITIVFSESVDDFDDTGTDITFGGTATATVESITAARGSTTNYTATISPTGSGSLEIKVPANAADDTADNGNTESNTLTVAIDVDPPTVTLSNVPSTPQNGNFDITITFNETVTGFTEADIDLDDTVGRATASVSGSGKDYTATITPTTDGTLTIHVPAGGVEDTAGNGNEASSQSTVTIDTTPPTVESITGAPSGEQKAAFDLTVTFSEAVNGFATDDLTVTGEATATNVAGSDGDTTYTVTITPNADKEGNISVQVKADAVTDTAGNSNTAASAATSNIYIDTIVPMATISTPPSGEQNGPFDLTITFNEEVDGFDVADDIAVVGEATASLKETVTAKTVYKITITPNANKEGPVTVQVKANAVTDAASNPNTASAVTTAVHIDTIVPTVVISDVPMVEKNVAFTITITFNEVVNDFALADISVGGEASAGSLTETTTQKVYTALITPNPGKEGDVTLQINASVVTDNAGNNNTASTEHTVHIDTIAPTVSIGAPPTGEQKDPFTITVTFTEPMKNFTKEDVTVTGPAAATGMSVDTAKEVYTVTITPNATSEGNVTFQIAANVATDNALNNNTASAVTTAVHIDTIAPTVTITGVPDIEKNVAFDITITFSEVIKGFVLADDLAITGAATAGSLTATTPNKVFTATITPTAASEEDVSFQVKANAVTDNAGNGNTVSPATVPASVHIDTIAPTVAITGVPTIEKNVAFDITITFSEVINGFALADDLAITGAATAGSLTATTPNKVFTATITPTAASEEDVSFQVKANAVTDNAGNGNTVSPATVPASVHIDTIAPTVTITGVPTIEKNVAFDLTVTFSEPVSGFTTASVDITGAATATAATANTDNSVYTVTITPNANQAGDDVSFEVPADAVQDLALNNNTVSPPTVPASVHIDTVVPTIVSITGVPDIEKNVAFDITITFDEVVNGFTASDLGNLVHATATVKSGSDGASVYVVTITPNATTEGGITLQVPVGAVQDPALNNNTISTKHTVHIDTIVPTVTISDVPDIEKNVPFDITITFNEVVNGFAAAAVAVTGPATASLAAGTDGDAVYTVTITPNTTSEGDVTLQVSANTVLDFALNNNTASTTHTMHVDTLDPTVAITGVPTIEKNVPFDLTVTFSEPVSGFTTADVDITGAATATAATANTDNSIYTVTITPNPGQAGDDVSFEVPADAVQDLALNNNTVSPATVPTSVHVDTVVPTVTLSAPPTDEQNGPFDLTVTFSEVVNGFAADDVAVTGPATASLTSGTAGADTYVITITPNPTSEGGITVQVSANAILDFALNPNTASNTPSAYVDTIVPTVAITGFPTEIQYESFSVRIEFLEDVTGFELSDIAFTGDAVVEDAVLTEESLQAYTLTITPHEDTDGDIIITVPADVAIDAALNNNVASPPQAVPVAPVWIPDPNLRVAARLALGLVEGEDFSRTQLSLLTTFDAVAPQIVDLTGVEHAINLTRLNLSGNAIADLTALATLTNLTTLNLSDNTITFIAPLEDMTALTVLELKGNSIADLTPLTGLTALKTLNLRENAVVDVTPIAELSMLNHLDLTLNRIRDVEPLLALKNLVTLRISGNPLLNADILVGLAPTIEIDGTLPDLTPDPGLSRVLRTQLGTDPTKQITEADLKGLNTLELGDSDIEDLSGLEHATDLTTLGLSDNAITDITPLQNLTQLTTLNLNGNTIINITVLRELTQLTTLDLSNNNITDITPLQALTQLRVLRLGGNNIADITPLQGLTQLTTLDISDNTVTDITLLPTFSQLTTLHLSNNPVGDLGPLASLTRLTTLSLSGHSLSDVGILSGLTGLRTLNLSDNAIVDATPLQRLQALTTLNLSGNALSTVDAIAVLTALTHLDISGNTVTDVTPLAGLTRLTHLNASLNNIGDVGPLAALTSLAVLDLTANAIVDVSPLAGLVNLRTLWLAENPILNTAPLYPLTQGASPVDSDIAITQYPPWDVNADGSVNAEDSALVTAALGQSGRDIEDPRTDVNGDDTVDNADLLLVTENLDNAPGAAPSALETFTGLDRATLAALDRAQLQATLDRLLIESDGSLKYTRAIQLLQTLLAELVPVDTRLFANYPNPFNPETWIPYQLAKTSTVEIFIYDARGVLVRHLVLGHQRAGYYTEKSRAAYWDGRNTVGERVASGIYFYRLEADNASLLRKMLILK